MRAIAVLSRPTGMKVRQRIGALVLGVVVVFGGWIVKDNWWPSGSDNVNRVTDGTPLKAIIVCTMDNEVLWRIVAPANVALLGAIPYGSVPPAFLQEIPPAGMPPRDFLPKETLQVRNLSATEEMGITGVATGVRKLRSVAQWGGRRRPAPLDCRPEDS